ncbi:phosphohistidine phosphatase SixA [Mycobacterium sp. JS623]|nr:phosphohistidine phosphatase SixA [Mycobacterium sp. JS623]
MCAGKPTGAETTDCDGNRPAGPPETVVSANRAALCSTLPGLTVDTVTDRYRTLLLLRHAKSDYPTGVADHERPLAPRGKREAGLAGDWLRANAPAIDAVLCSTATRTRETLARTRVEAPVDYLDRLYDATPGAVIEEINRVGPDVETLLVIGHEPTMSALALGLAAAEDSNNTAAERISTKFPTSAIAVLRTGEPWDQLTLSGAALVGFHVPR